VGSYGGQMTLLSDVIIQNLSPKTMPHASLNVSLLDKDHVRIGHGLLVVSDLNSGESAKVLFQCDSVGVPSTLAIGALNNGGTPSSRAISLQIISDPAGTSLKVDGKDQGFTPTAVDLTVGNHMLELQKDGYELTRTPVDIASDETTGGSIKIVLGGLSNDVIMLRDGTSLSGELLSVTLENVLIRVEGTDQKIERNRVSKMFLVERTLTTSQPPTKPAQPANSKLPHQ
jgi:hypothetical protein